MARKGNVTIKCREIDAMVCNRFFFSHDISKFTNLKFIQLTSAGFDRVPVETIKERGIELYNARGVYSTRWLMGHISCIEHYKQGWFFKKRTG